MKKKKLSAGGIVGIVAAVIAVIFGVIMYRKRKHRQRSEQFEIEHTRDNNTAPNIPTAPYIPAAPRIPAAPHIPAAQERTDPGVILMPALGANNLAPPPYSEAASFNEYVEDFEVPTYEEVMANEQIYDVMQDDSRPAPTDFRNAFGEGGYVSIWWETRAYILLVTVTLPD